MENKKPDPTALHTEEELREPALENTPETAADHPDEEHTQSNYRYAVKVLLVLLGIILLIAILKISGVRFSLKELLPGCIAAAETRFGLPLLF